MKQQLYPFVNADHQAWTGGRDCTFRFEVDSDGVQVSSDLDARGREVPDPTPMAPPVGFSKSPSLADFVKRMIQNEVSRVARDNEFETFEESDDFEIEDDPLDPLTPYEAVFDPRYGLTPEVVPASVAPSNAGGGGAQPPGGEPSAPASSAPEASPASAPPQPEKQ